MNNKELFESLLIIQKKKDENWFWGIENVMTIEIINYYFNVCSNKEEYFIKFIDCVIVIIEINLWFKYININKEKKKINWKILKN